MEMIRFCRRANSFRGTSIMTHGRDLPTPNYGEISLLQTGSIILLTIGGAIILALQPILLAAMLHDGRLTTVQMGRAATSELLGTAIMVGVAGAYFRPQRLRATAIFVVFLAALANILTMASSGNEIIAARSLSGGCSGILFWLFANMTVRSAMVERLVGICLATQSIIALCLTTLCTQWLIPRFGGSGAYSCLLGFDILLIVPAMSIPDQFAILPKLKRATLMTRGGALASLVSVGAFMSANISFWVYIVPFAAEMGLSKSTINLAIDLGITFQILGGLSAAAIGRRLSYFTVIGACEILGLLAIVLLGMNISSIIFLVTIACLGLIWMIIPAYFVPFVIAADPSRRSAMFITTAQLSG
jgi:MFS transporter, DHA1 family, inner membrane transport protein